MVKNQDNLFKLSFLWKEMIIGVTGAICSGVDSFGKILQEKGFRWFSYSDILREEAGKRKIDISRGVMQDLGDELRKRHGSGVLSMKIIEKMNAGEDYVVGNIRNPGEVEELKKLGDFILVKLDASAKVRFGRMKSRGRVGDPQTLEEFEKVEARDLGKGQEKHGQQHAIVFEMAKKVVENNHGDVELREKVEELLKELEWGGQ